MNEIYKKDKKITSNCESSNDEDVVVRAYLDTKRTEVMGQKNIYRERIF